MSINHGKKIFFSNLSYKTTEQILINFFSIYGSIEELNLLKDDQDQSLRKGFIIYKNINSVNNLMLKRPHFIDNIQIHIHRAIPNQYRSAQIDLLQTHFDGSFEGCQVQQQRCRGTEI